MAKKKNDSAAAGVALIVILGIALIMWILENILLIIGLGLLGWGIYELVSQKHIKSRKIQALVAIAGLVSIIAWAGFSNSDTDKNDSTIAVEDQSQNDQQEQLQLEEQPLDERASEPTTEIEQVAAITDEQKNESKEQSKPKEQPSQLSDASLIPAVVTGIVDGDTIDVKVNGKEERLRLLLVDTPETKDPDKPVQPFGPEATEFAEKTLSGKEVKLEFDGPERDKYDRLLVYLWVGDRIFNQMLLEEGLARIAYVYDPPYKYYDDFVAAQEKAKKAKKGIWSIPEYVTDDGFNEKVVALNSANNKKSSSNKKQEKQTAKQTEVYYARCADARAAGAAPLYRGEPGYRPELDRDGDGIACE